MIGKTLAHYEIAELLGKGGMGEVYRARDTKLGRDVALKFLPADLATDPERLARFRREAKLLAALNHPNIAGLHGVEELEDGPFLVMELVEGQDLSTAMATGSLPIETAADLAKQIAAGLESAHECGVVHRDLKPQNIKLTPDGNVKILDFGLALPYAASSENQDLSQSPTITAALTQAGTLLGTAAYMSPEQATGRPVDQRTDIWSFGVILFEMLTGRTAFHEEKVGETLAAIIRGEPDWDALPDGLPRDLRRLLERCLRKDRRKRLHAIADARLELEELNSTAAAAASTKTTSPWRPTLGWLLPLVVGVTVGLLVGRPSVTTDATSPTRVVRSSIELPEDVQLAGWSSPALELSPDGTALAYVGRDPEGQYLFLRNLAEGRSIKIPDSEGAEGPFFSPDGRWIGFGAGNISGNSDEPDRLKKYSLDSGLTSTVCGVGDYFGGCWREDGTIFFMNVQPLGLYRVPAEGGAPVQIDESADQISMGWPQLLPGNEKALVTQWIGVDFGRPATIDLETGALTDLGISGVYCRWVPTGHLLVADAERIVRAYRFDPATGVLGQGNAQVLEEVTLTGNEAAAFAISDDGTFVYSQGPVDGSRHDLATAVWITDDGVRTQVDLPTDYYDAVDISPDGTRLALSVNSRDLKIFDLGRGTQLHLPRGETAGKMWPLWHPDGNLLAFAGIPTEGVRGFNICVQSSDGVQPPRAIEDRAGEFFPGSWVPETSRLLHHGYPSEQDIHVRLYDVDVADRSEPRELLNEEANLYHPAIAPGGEWMAYVSDETGHREIFLRSFPDLARKIPVGSGSRPQWTSDGRTLYFLQAQGRLLRSVWSVSITYDGDDVVPGPPLRLFELEDALLWDVDPSGGRHLVFFGVPGAGEIRTLQMVQGWWNELEQLLPAGGR